MPIFRLVLIILLAAATFARAASAQVYQKDTEKPIEISSDTLDVDQAKQIAVFTGNVVAIQGTMRLRSDKMTVYYTKKPESPAAASASSSKAIDPKAAQTEAAQSKAAESKAVPPGVQEGPDAGKSPASGQNAISKIVVNGHVILATPEESAQGNDGLYEVDKKLLHLTGNVLLTRGENVLRGTQLDYNLATGRSLLVGQAGNLPNNTGGRVRGVFLPGAEGDKSKPPAPPPATKK